MKRGDGAALPPSWHTVRFGDVVRNVRVTERDPLTAGLERYVGLEHLDPESLHVRRWGLVAEGTTFTQKFVRGQILFGKRRAYQRKVAVAAFDGICSGDLLVFEPSNDRLLPELLPFIVQSEGFFAHALRTSAGSLSPRTRWKDLADYEFPLPPLDEQRRIAEILWVAEEAEERFGDLIQVARSTKGAIASSLLDFSEIGLERVSNKMGECPLVSIEALGRLGHPVLKTGPFGSSLKSEHFTASGVPVLNISALGEAGLEREGVFFISEDYARELGAYRVSEGDIVFSRVADVGRCILVSKEYEGWIISSNLIRIRVDPGKLVPLYLLCLLKYSPFVKRQVQMVTAGGGRMLVNQKTLGELRFPLPALDAQARVCRLVQDFELRAADTIVHANTIHRLRNLTREQLLSGL